MTVPDNHILVFSDLFCYAINKDCSCMYGTVTSLYTGETSMQIIKQLHTIWLDRSAVHCVTKELFETAGCQNESLLNSEFYEQKPDNKYHESSTGICIKVNGLLKTLKNS